MPLLQPYKVKPPLYTPLDWSNPITRGLTFCCPLNEGSGLPYEIIRGIAPANYNNVTWIPSPNGNAIAGSTTTNSYLKYNAVIPYPNNFTSACWCKATGTAQQISLGFCNSGNVGPVGDIGINIAGVAGCVGGALRNDASTQFQTTSTPVTFNDGNWHFIVCTFDNIVGCTVYVDGYLPAQTRSGGAITGAMTTDNISLVSLYRTSVTYYDSSVDLPLVWNRLLSLQEISQLSGNPWQLFQPRLIAQRYPQYGVATLTSSSTVVAKPYGVVWQAQANLSCTSSCSSWYGKYIFDFSGANGSSWAQGTPRIGTWTIQNGRLQSPNDGDNALLSTIEAAYVNETNFAVEFDYWLIGKGTGSTVYYPCFRYRCDSWISTNPNGYYQQIANTGASVTLIRSVNDGTRPTVSSNPSTPVFTIGDKVTVRLTCQGNTHTLRMSVNGGTWTTALNTTDGLSTPPPKLTGGSVCFMVQRGQTQFGNVKLWYLGTIQSAAASLASRSSLTANAMVTRGSLTTVYTSPSSVAFTTSDKGTVRYTVKGNNHKLQMSVSGGPWVTVYDVTDTLGSPPPKLSVGSFAFMVQRGQTQFGNVKLWSLAGTTQNGIASVTSQSNLAASALNVTNGLAALTARSALTASAKVTRQATAALRASSLIQATATGGATRLGVASLQSRSVIVGTGAVSKRGTASLISRSSLSATSKMTRGGTAPLLARSVITGTPGGGTTRLGLAALQGNSQLTAAAKAIRGATAALQSRSLLTATSRATLRTSAALKGNAAITATPGGGTTRLGQASLQSRSLLLALASIPRSGTATIRTNSVLTGKAAITRGGIASIRGNSVLVGKALVGTLRLGTASLQGNASLFAKSKMTLRARASLQVNPKLEAEVAGLVVGKAKLVCVCTFMAAPYIRPTIFSSTSRRIGLDQATSRRQGLYQAVSYARG